jgi:hypothetical protein
MDQMNLLQSNPSKVRMILRYELYPQTHRFPGEQSNIKISSFFIWLHELKLYV